MKTLLDECAEQARNCLSSNSLFEQVSYGISISCVVVVVVVGGKEERNTTSKAEMPGTNLDKRGATVLVEDGGGAVLS